MEQLWSSRIPCGGPAIRLKRGLLPRKQDLIDRSRPFPKLLATLRREEKQLRPLVSSRHVKFHDLPGEAEDVRFEAPTLASDSSELSMQVPLYSHTGKLSM